MCELYRARVLFFKQRNYLGTMVGQGCGLEQGIAKRHDSTPMNSWQAAGHGMPSLKRRTRQLRGRSRNPKGDTDDSSVDGAAMRNTTLSVASSWRGQCSAVMKYQVRQAVCGQGRRGRLHGFRARATV